MKLGGSVLRVTTKTTDQATMGPFCSLSLMVLGFPSHCTWVGIAIPSFSASNSSRIFSRAYVPCRIY